MSFQLTARDIDRIGSVPLYQQIADHIAAAIHSGELQPGDALPSEAELERTLKISRTVVRDGIAELVRDGLVVKRHGASTRVADKPRLRWMDAGRYQDELSRLDTLAKSNEEHPLTSAFITEHDTTWEAYEVEASYQREKATPRDAEYLDIAEGTPVIRRTLIKYVDGQPQQIQRSTVTAKIAKGTVLEDPKQQPFPGGTIAELYVSGHRVTKITEGVWARMPTGEERRMLQQVSPGPVWDIVRVFHTDAGPVEASRVITPTAENMLRYTTRLA